MEVTTITITQSIIALVFGLLLTILAVQNKVNVNNAIRKVGVGVALLAMGTYFYISVPSSITGIVVAGFGAVIMLATAMMDIKERYFLNKNESGDPVIDFIIMVSGIAYIVLAIAGFF